jgi:hypothetical protein
MTEPQEELLEIANRLEGLAEAGEEPSVKESIDAVKDAANRVGKAWSGSWLGYHADVYYEGLQAPPPGANFSQEWGLVDRTYGRDTTGSWQQFNPDDVKQVIMQMAGEPDLEPARKLADEAGKAFDVQKSDVLSLLITENSDSPDPYLETLKTDAENTVIHTSSEILRIWQPKGSVMTRDTLALGRGRRSPPHLSVLADLTSLHQPFAACSALSAIARKAGSHILRKRRQRRKAEIRWHKYIHWAWAIAPMEGFEGLYQ